MKTLDILKMGFGNLFRRKTRTLLTVIGVVVGAAAIVITLSFGIGMNENLKKSIESMGDLTIIEVYEWAWRPSGGDNNEYINAQNVLDEALFEKIKTWDGVLAATPYFDYWNLSMHAGKKYESVQTNIVGIDSSFLPYMKISVSDGYMPGPNDENWILFGSRRARMFVKDMSKMRQKDWDEIYNSDLTKPPKMNILKESVYLKAQSNDWWENPSTGNWEPRPITGKPKQYSFDKIGIIKYEENMYGWDENQYNVYVDYKIAAEMQKDFEKLTKVKAKDSRAGKFNWLRIKVKDLKTTEIIKKKLMDEEGIMLNYGLSDIRDEMQKNQSVVQLILGGMGAITLIVSAIGIANTMFMSIYERTKEIGVMKVLGCPLSGIKSMFLFEASMIGFLGGLVGTGLSLAVSYALNNIEAVKKALGNMSGSGYYGNAEQGDISVIPLWLMGLAVVFATVIGLASGYLPARRATKISALEAIRNE
jgi:ABC-type antimicrobial peptide transport system permease subunit